MDSEFMVLGGSALVVALMVGIAWALGFRRAARIDRDELERLLALAEPGARVEAAAIATDAKAALACVSGGKLMAAKVMGGDVSVRVYPLSAVSVRLNSDCLRAAFADLGFPTLDIKLDGDPPAWLAELAASGGGQK